MIRYRAPIADTNISDLLDSMRELGAADIVSVCVPKGASRDLVMKVIEGECEK